MSKESQVRGKPGTACLLGRGAPIIAVVAAVLMGCMAERASGIDESDCDAMIEEAIDEMVNQLDTGSAERVRRDLEETRSRLTNESNLSHVRERIRRSGIPQSLVRLELASWNAPGYASIWFVEFEDAVFEYSTDAQSDGILHETRVPREEWLAYAKYLQTLNNSDMMSVVSPSVVDAPFYFLCIHTQQRSGALVIRAIPQRLPQFSLLAKTFGLSQTKHVPPEIARCLEESRNCPTELDRFR